MEGQISQWTHHGETIDFSHDATGQLTGADYTSQTDENYTYDANGNRTDGNTAIGPNNQLFSDGTFDYTYDAEGNLIRKTDIATGEFTEYEFDHRNRMVRATTMSTGGVILNEVEFKYDALDRRIAKTVDADGDGLQAPETTYTVYDGENAWADFSESGTIIARYLFGDLADEIIARYRPGEGVTWYLTDHLGTIRDQTNASGALINTVAYDSFGNILSQTNAAAGDRFKFSGREFDSELGLYYYRSRYYDPTTGRFLSQDALGFAAGDANFYRYVSNNPLHATDPSGNLAILEKLAKTNVQLAIGVHCAFGDVVLSGKSNDPFQWAFAAAAAFAPLGAGTLGAAFGGGQAFQIVTKSLFVRALGPSLGAIGLGFGVVGTYDAWNKWQAGDGGFGLFVHRFLCTSADLLVAFSAFKNAAKKLAASASEKIRALRFGPEDLVYGPTAGGKLRQLSDVAGGQLLDDIGKPINMTWKEFTAVTLENAIQQGKRIHFDLTHVEDLQGVLKGTAYPDATTTFELQYLRKNWSRFKNYVTFYDFNDAQSATGIIDSIF